MMMACESHTAPQASPVGGRELRDQVCSESFDGGAAACLPFKISTQDRIHFRPTVKNTEI